MPAQVPGRESGTRPHTRQSAQPLDLRSGDSHQIFLNFFIKRGSLGFQAIYFSLSADFTCNKSDWVWLPEPDLEVWFVEEDVSVSVRLADLPPHLQRHVDVGPSLQTLVTIST